MSSNEQFERDFESFLKDDDSRIAALYRKLPRPEPDAKLDAAVLAMSRRAATSAPAVRARQPRWLPALSAAAVVALAAGVAFRVGPQVWQQRDTKALQKSVDENAARSAPAAPEPAETPQSANAGAYREKDVAAPGPAAEATPPPAPDATAAPAAGYAAPAKTQVLRPQVRKMENAARHADAPAPQAFPPEAEPEQELKSSERGAAAAAADAVTTQAAGAIAAKPERAMRDEKAQAPAPVLAAPQPASAATPRAVPPAPPARVEERAMQESAPAAETPPAALQTQTTAGAPAESRLAAPASAPAAKAAKPAPVRSKDPNAQLYPEHWLANIRTMLHERKRDEALRSLAEFRKMYPDYHLPDDLLDLK